MDKTDIIDGEGDFVEIPDKLTDGNRKIVGLFKA